MTARHFLTLIGLALGLGCTTPAPADERIDRLASMLADTTDATGLSGLAVAPALSVDSAELTETRITAINRRMIDEIKRVMTAFSSAPAGDQDRAVRDTVRAFDPETAAEGAARLFEGDGPSLSIMRQVLVVSADGLGPAPVARAMDRVSSFERSAKTDDTYYEYANPRDLNASEIIDRPGDPQSWTSNAAPRMELNTIYTLKKCRHIAVLGWYCNTADYQRRAIASPAGAETEILLTVLRPLAPGGDHRMFDGDRSKNIVAGYTALYLVTRSRDAVLIYSLGYQSKPGKPSQTSALNSGHQEEYRQLASRFSSPPP